MTVLNGRTDIQILAAGCHAANYAGQHVA